MLFAQREGHTITRNLTFFKRIPHKYISLAANSEDDEEEMHIDFKIPEATEQKQPTRPLTSCMKNP